MTVEFFIGKWTSINSASRTIMIHHFIDKENVTITFQSETHTSKYTLEKQDGLTIMTFTNAKLISKFVIIPKGNNAFLMYTPKEYERMQLASKSAPGTIAWGWSEQPGIEFNRQAAK